MKGVFGLAVPSWMGGGSLGLWECDDCNLIDRKEKRFAERPRGPGSK